MAKIHILDRRFTKLPTQGKGVADCGIMADAKNITLDPRKVTCVSCKSYVAKGLVRH